MHCPSGWMVQYWVTPTSDLPYDFREMETNCFFAGREDTPNYASPFKPDIWNMKISTGSKCLLQKIHRGLQQCEGFIRGSRAQGCTSSNRGFDNKGFPLGFLDVEATNWNNKQDQTRSNKMLAGSPATTKRTLKLPLIFPTRLRPETPMVWPITLQVTNAKLLTWVSTTSTDL